MARGYRPVNRDQVFLLPPDMRDWLPDEHLVWFLLDVVAELDTTGLHARYRTGGVGRAAYDPDMLLALVMYGWSQQVRSSRRIARLCAVDVAFRLICAGDIPDHCTISRFIAGCEEAVTDLFAQVLVLCRRAGLARLGTVALDGTKIAANASLQANRTREGIEKELAHHTETTRARATGDDTATTQAAGIIAEQIATDTTEDTLHGQNTGDELPADLADPRTRPARLRAALQALTDRTPPPPPPPAARPEVLATGRRPGGRSPNNVDAVTEAHAVLARVRGDAHTRYDQLTAARAGRAAAGRGTTGNPPNPPHTHYQVRRAETRLARAIATATKKAAKEAAASPRAAEHVNTTDPASRIMKTRNGWVQGYNCQYVTTQDQIIIAESVTDDANDTAQYTPMIDKAVAATDTLPVSLTKGVPTTIGTALADNGYWTPTAATHPGPDRLIATGNRHTLNTHPDTEPTTTSDTSDTSDTDTTTTGGDVECTAREQMTRRLTTPEGRATYKHRAATIEPTIGQIKDVTGLRRFRRRGKPATQAENTLTATIHNLLKLHRALHRTATPAPG